MILYFSRGACSLAPHIVLKEANIACDLVSVDLRKKVTSTGDDFWQINPKGYVPALRLNSGEVLSEDVAVLLYLAEQAPQADLFPKPSTRPWFQGLEWLIFISTEMHKGLGTLAFGSTLSDAHKEQVKSRLVQRLNFIAKHLELGTESGMADASARGAQPFLLGKQFSVADAYMYTVLRWMPYAKDPELNLETGWPVVAAYMKRVHDRPGVQSALAEENLLNPTTHV